MNVSSSVSCGAFREEWKFFAFASALYLCLCLVVKASLPFPDLADFWIPGAQLILDGRPQDLYTVRLSIFGQSFPNSYPPLFFFILAPFVALAEWLKWLPPAGDSWSLSSPGASVVQLPFVFADLLAAAALCAASRLSCMQRRWLFALLLLHPLLWFSSVRMQHHESWVLAALTIAVLCLEAQRWRSMLLSLVMALLLKTTALLALPAFALALWTRGHRFLAWSSVLVPVSALGICLMPWLYFRWESTTYALFAFEALRPVFGISSGKVQEALGLHFLGQGGANWVLVTSVALFCALLRTRLSIRGLIAGSFLFLPLLARWMSPHYLVLPCGLLLLWELSRPGLPVFSLLASFLLWELQSPYFPEVGLEDNPAVLLRSLLWVLACSSLLCGFLHLSLKRPENPREKEDLPKSRALG